MHGPFAYEQLGAVPHKLRRSIEAARMLAGFLTFVICSARSATLLRLGIAYNFLGKTSMIPQ